MKVVDTDIFIDLFRGFEKAVEFFRNNNDLIFSSITEGEILSGKDCSNKQDREEILHFLNRFEKIPVDNPLIQIAGNIRRETEVKLPDAIIAATAIITDSVLLTRNVKHFNKIKNLKLEKLY